MADRFNDFFINIGPKSSNDMGRVDENSYRKHLNHSSLTSFHFDLVDSEGLTKTLNSLRSKSSSGYDVISTRLLKTISPALIEPLRIIINQSLISGIYPERLKIVIEKSYSFIQKGW